MSTKVQARYFEEVVFRPKQANYTPRPLEENMTPARWEWTLFYKVTPDKRVCNKESDMGWVPNHTALWQGHDIGNYDTVTQSGLITHSQLFNDRQLAKGYRCLHETLERDYSVEKRCIY